MFSLDSDAMGRKLVTTVVSTFTAHYIHLWSTYFPDMPLQSPYLPSFDGRAVVYPTLANLRDYMSWRQVDCKSLSHLRCSFHCPGLHGPVGHINNLYNTTFWAMVLRGGMKNTDAELELKVSVSHWGEDIN